MNATLEHFSGELFEPEERELGAQRVHHKPRGFWFSVNHEAIESVQLAKKRKF
jgi:hypothetical protein